MLWNWWPTTEFGFGCMVSTTILLMSKTTVTGSHYWILARESLLQEWTACVPTNYDNCPSRHYRDLLPGNLNTLVAFCLDQLNIYTACVNSYLPYREFGHYSSYFLLYFYLFLKVFLVAILLTQLFIVIVSYTNIIAEILYICLNLA